MRIMIAIKGPCAHPKTAPQSFGAGVSRLEAAAHPEGWHPHAACARRRVHPQVPVQQIRWPHQMHKLKALPALPQPHLI